MTEIDQYELDTLRNKARKYDDDVHVAKIAIAAATVVVVIVIGIIFLFKGVGPKLALYKANTENQAVIKEQEAHSKAAEYAARSAITQAHAKAEAMVIEAHGLAESQEIIATTLTPEYLHYLYIEAIRDNPNQVIYIPTEAGFPIVEAGRAVDDLKVVTP